MFRQLDRWTLLAALLLGVFLGVLCAAGEAQACTGTPGLSLGKTCCKMYPNSVLGNAYTDFGKCQDCCIRGCQLSGGGSGPCATNCSSCCNNCSVPC